MENLNKITPGTLCVTCQKPATRWRKDLDLFRSSSCGDEKCEKEAFEKELVEFNKPNQTIELDCRPGFPRPGDLIEEVIKDSGLSIIERSGAFMGNWTWDYAEVDPETWDKASKIIGPRIETLYKSGKIRYGSW